MPQLTLDYRCCDQSAPLYLKHSEVEDLAMQARLQLVGAEVDALPLDVLTQIDALKINGLRIDLWVDTDHPVNDEQGEPVLGVCEYDPGASPDAAMVSVTPLSDSVSAELVLSTFAHELGHAVFDAPGWIAVNRRGPGLFDDPGEFSRKAFRTTTRNAEHLATTPVTAQEATASNLTSSQRTTYFAELRANEFMGSLLVPRPHLTRAAEALAPDFGVTLRSRPSLFAETSPDLKGSLSDVEGLQKSLAQRFGVHRRFIEVRMARYGLLPTQGLPAF
jgi:hypothetical protein